MRTDQSTLPSDRRICVIGFQKSGTTSMRNALRALGYSVGAAHSEINRRVDPKAPDAVDRMRKITLNLLAKRDAIQDSPAAWFFEDFDEAYPRSKFILTYRDPDSWVGSLTRHFTGTLSPVNQIMYGRETFEGAEAELRALYVAQIEKIRDYFKDRPDDFAEMDLTAGAGWLDLVTFLGPDFLPPFPHTNSAEERERRWARQGAKKAPKKGALLRRLLSR